MNREFESIGDVYDALRAILEHQNFEINVTGVGRGMIVESYERLKTSRDRQLEIRDGKIVLTVTIGEDE